MTPEQIALAAQAATQIRSLVAQLEEANEKLASVSQELQMYRDRDDILKVAAAIRAQNLMADMSDEDLVHYVASRDLNQLQEGIKLASSDLRLGSVSGIPGGAPANRQQVEAALSAFAGEN